jgi:SAM-dependent methyltransferase
MNIQTLFHLLNRRARARRMSRFVTLLDLDEQTTVLDVGGALGIWSSVSVRPKLTILNVGRSGAAPEAVEVIGDGRRLPFPDQCFDVVFSNSVIEHVGRVEDQCQFAEEIRRVGRSFYVQTPNRWFPIEPHVLTPLVHFFPKRMQRRMLRNFTLWGLMTRPSPDYIQAFVDSTRLLTARELSAMFPRAELYRERIAGLTKSLMVVGRHGSAPSAPLG